MSAVRSAYWVFRRELHGMLRAPLLFVLGGGFLAIQGVAFAGLVGELSDLRRAAPLGALLEGQLAGTLLTWVLGLVVLALLGMRTIAEDRRSGAWELLLTAQVGEGAAVVGKWLAAATLYAILWVPTLLYLVVVAHYRADAGGWDARAIATGYLGAIAIGAALLAWAVAASAATSSVLGAGALAFVLLLGWFLVGELPALAPHLGESHPTLAALLAAIGIRSAALGFARGDVQLGTLVFLAGLALVGLSLAITLSCAGRRRRAEVRARSLGTLGIAVAAVLAGIVVHRHPQHWDASAAHRNSLDPSTLTTLGDLAAANQHATLTIVEPTLAGLAPVFDEIARIAERMAAASRGALVVRRADPATLPGGLPAIAHSVGLAPGDLAAGGAVIVTVATSAPSPVRTEVVDLMSMATVTQGPGAAPMVQSLGVEQRLAGTLAALVRTEPVTVCATTGHGEFPFAAITTGASRGTDWSLVAARLTGLGFTVATLDTITTETLRPCRVVIVAGPTTPFTGEEALAIQTYLQGAGHLALAVAGRPVPSSPNAGQLASTGLESIVHGDGIDLPIALVVDPTNTVRDVPGAFLVETEYGTHAIARGFAGRRPTFWFQPRPVVLRDGTAQPLVRAHADAFLVTNFEQRPPTKDPADQTAFALAALGKSTHVVVFGSAESLLSSVVAGGYSALDLLFARSIEFLAGTRTDFEPPLPPAPDQVRLVLTDSQRTTIIALCAGGIPLTWLALGGALLLWRRRRDEAAA